VVGACLVVLSVSACGGSGHKHAHTTGANAASSASAIASQPATLAAMARFLAVKPASITTSASTGNNAMPQCTFTAQLAPAKRVVALANVDNGPSPYFRLERTEVEAAQPFTSKRLSLPPQAVTGLGIEADWFPQYPQLMATDGARLITVSVTWRGATQSRERALAKALARTYLRKLSKAAVAKALGYPSG